MTQSTRTARCAAFGETVLALVLLAALALGCRAAARHYYRTVYPVKYGDLIQTAAADNGLDPRLLCAIIKAESDFVPTAVSVNDACGLMQLLPSTLDWLQTLTPDDDHYTRADLFDPAVNVRYGAYFVARLQAQFGDVATIAAAYHAGHNGVQRWLQNPAYSADGVHLDVIPYADTAQYVRRIVRNYEIYCQLYPNGI